MESIYFVNNTKIETTKRIIKLQNKILHSNWNEFECKQISHSSVLYLTRSKAAAAGPMFGCCACVRVHCSPCTFSGPRNPEPWLHKMGDRSLFGTTTASAPCNQAANQRLHAGIGKALESSIPNK